MPGHREPAAFSIEPNFYSRQKGTWPWSPLMSLFYPNPSPLKRVYLPPVDLDGGRRGVIRRELEAVSTRQGSEVQRGCHPAHGSGAIHGAIFARGPLLCSDGCLDTGIPVGI